MVAVPSLELRNDPVTVGDLRRKTDEVFVSILGKLAKCQLGLLSPFPPLLNYAGFHRYPKLGPINLIWTRQTTPFPPTARIEYAVNKLIIWNPEFISELTGTPERCEFPMGTLPRVLPHTALSRGLLGVEVFPVVVLIGGTVGFDKQFGCLNRAHEPIVEPLCRL